jgi:hypothetical protein
MRVSMNAASCLSDHALLERMPVLVRAERAASAEVIEHLVEIDRRRLYLDQACGSLYAYCQERLGYSEDESHTRVRVARVAQKLPSVLEALRRAAIHLTGLFLLSNHLTEDNHATLLAAARGKSRRGLERLIAAWFPRPDVEQRMTPIAEQTALGLSGPGGSSGSSGTSGPGATRPGTGDVRERPKLEPLSAERYRVEFTANAELAAKIEQARALVSHKLPSGDLAALFEQALDHLIRHETKRRTGAGRRSKNGASPMPRRANPDSRYVPVDVARQVWERDEWQCSFVDAQGRRCSERRFLTTEHRHPHALGGPPTVDNLCLLCAAHNAHTARQVFGEEQIANKRAVRERARAKRRDDARTAQTAQAGQRSAHEKVRFALRHMGFRERESAEAIAELQRRGIEPSVEPLLRAALNLLAPAATQ